LSATAAATGCSPRFSRSKAYRLRQSSLTRPLWAVANRATAVRRDRGCSPAQSQTAARPQQYPSGNSRNPAAGVGSVGVVDRASCSIAAARASRRWGARNTAEPVSPTCRLVRSNSKSPAASGADRIWTPNTTSLVTSPFRRRSHRRRAGRPLRASQDFGYWPLTSRASNPASLGRSSLRATQQAAAATSISPPGCRRSSARKQFPGHTAG
jgi:hypothetical protein